MTKSLALALGGGGARGIAHIAVLEVLDEMGVRPTAIAGTSVGAMIGAAYAAGMSGRDIRRHVIALAHNRSEVLRRLVAARAGSFASLFSGGFGSATQVDGEKFCEHFLPAAMPEDFSELKIPLMVIASDLYRRQQVVLSSGPLRRAVAASMALPTVVRPIVIDDRVLVDGGATNPLPFDQLRDRADVVVAVDISGEPNDTRRDIPTPWEAILATILVMGQAITTEKLKHGAPDLIIRPNVGLFRTLDFFQASAILRVCEAGKAEIRQRLTALLRRGFDADGILRRRRASLTHVAALGIVERVGRQIDPARRGKVAHGDRLLPLQGHHEGLAIAGRFAFHEGDALDLESAADEALERLLLLCGCAVALRGGQCNRQGDQTRGGCLQHTGSPRFLREWVAGYSSAAGPATNTVGPLLIRRRRQWRDADADLVQGGDSCRGSLRSCCVR